MNNKLASRLRSVYDEMINSETCKICVESNHKKDIPSTFWYIGDNFEDKSSPRVAFVGKTTWGTWPEKTGKKHYEAYNHIKGDLRSAYYDSVTESSGKGHRFFSAIKKITKSLFNIQTVDCSFLEEIFITNLCKCNMLDEHGKDSYVNITIQEYFRSCSKILEREMIIVEPTHIVFFADEYRDIIDELGLGYEPNEVTAIASGMRPFTSKRTQKTKSYPWMVKRYSNKNRKMYVLVTRHPQGAYSEFEEAIVQWIKEPEYT